MKTAADLSAAVFLFKTNFIKQYQGPVTKKVAS